MRALFSQFSGLVGILTFVNQMLSGVAVERAFLSAAGAGLAVYVVLLLGDVVIQRILEQAAETIATTSASPTGQSSPGGQQPHAGQPSATSSAPPPKSSDGKAASGHEADAKAA